MYIRKTSKEKALEKYDKAKKKGIQLIGDKVIRDTLFEHLIQLYGADNEILEEVRFPAFTADVLMFLTGKKKYIVGFEVKSDRDTLKRLETQLREYLKYCNVVFVVTTLLHYKEVAKLLERAEFANVGLLVYKMTYEGKTLECAKLATKVDIKGLSTKWISKQHQLYRFEYYLKMLWEL